MVKVKMLCNLSGVSVLKKGTIAEFEENEAKRLVEREMAEYVEKGETKAKKGKNETNNS